MGVLDRLENEAREARQRRAAAADKRSRDEATVGAKLTPALDYAQQYLQRLADHLNELDGSVSTRYELEGLGVLVDLRQTSYRVARADGPAGAVTLRFDCTGNKPIAASIEGHAKAKSLAKGLKDARLTCRLRVLSERVMQLRVEAKVPVRVGFVADVEHGTVWIELRNLTALSVQRYGLAPEQVDEKLLDALAGLVLREPSEFDRMTGSVVTDDKRGDLQRKLLREQRRREAELAGGLRRFTFPAMEWFRRQFFRA